MLLSASVLYGSVTLVTVSCYRDTITVFGPCHKESCVTDRLIKFRVVAYVTNTARYQNDSHQNVRTIADSIHCVQKKTPTHVFLYISVENV